MRACAFLFYAYVCAHENVTVVDTEPEMCYNGGKMAATYEVNMTKPWEPTALDILLDPQLTELEAIKRNQRLAEKRNERIKRIINREEPTGSAIQWAINERLGQSRA